jgi:hypothetical protein
LTVSRNFHDTFLPVFYDQVNLQHYSTLRFSARWLISSAPLIRKITLSDEFLNVYSKAVVAYNERTTSDGDKDYHSMQVIPLPPMERLSGLTYAPSMTTRLLLTHKEERYRIIGMNFMRLCWAIELSPLLTQLSVGELFLSSRHEPGVFARVIGGLVHLRELKLKVQCDEELWEKVVVGIARHCPPMMQGIQLGCNLQQCSYSNALVLAQLDKLDKDEALLPMPQEPLLQLTKLDLESSPHYIPRSICRLLERCPELITLHPPPANNALNQTIIATCVAQHCPKLRRIYRQQPRWIHRRQGNLEECGSTTFGTIVNVIPRNTLQQLLIGENTRNDAHLCSMIPAHYESLISIKFPKCRALDRPTILGILRNCEALEVFEVQSWDDDLWEVSISLEEAGEDPWASNRIRVLELAIDVGEDIKFVGRWPPEEPSARYSERVMMQLERFFRQIGAQHRLTNLCLKITDNSKNFGKKCGHYSLFSFWSMLRLGKRTSDPSPFKVKQMGHLQLLSNLSELRTLTGSFDFRSLYRDNAITSIELDWYRKHWPRYQNNDLRNLEVLAKFNWRY